MKIKLIQKDNEVIRLQQRVNAQERQVKGLQGERDKLIQIAGDLKAQVLAHERQKEMETMRTKMNEHKEKAG